MSLPPFHTCPPLRRFMIVVGLALGLASFADASNEESELPLPTWEAAEWREHVRQIAPPLAHGLIPTLGEALLPPSNLPTAVAPKYADGPPVLEVEPTASFTPTGDASWFLPSPLIDRKEATTPLLPTPTVHLREVVPEFIAAALEWPADDPLIDPLYELPETQAEDVRRFLGFHADESAIPLRVILIGRHNTLVQTTDTLRLIEPTTSALAEKRAALLIYPMGEPWRARLFLPAAAYQAVSPAFLTDVIESCLATAAQTSDPEAQLHDYLVQLSIRLFWIEKHLHRTKDTPTASSNATLAEVLTHPAPSLAPHSQGQTVAITVAALAALGGPALMILGLRWMRRTRRAHFHRHQWTLPDPEPTQRLGGAFCGGGGAWASWDA